MRLYVTYGYGSNLRNCYSEVKGDDIPDCMQQVQAACGPAYAFTYTQEQWEADHQVERFGLTEVPLQPQVKV